MKKILVHSYRGGSGKTLISLNLAKQLENSNKRVLLLETDAFMPSFESVFNFQTRYSLNDFYDGTIGISESIHKLNEHLSIITCKSKFDPNQSIFSTNQKVHSNVLRKILPALDKLNQNFDYLIIDSPPGWGYLQINNLIIAESIVLVIRANQDAFNGTLKLIKAMYENLMNINQTYYVIWNQIPNMGEMAKYIELWEHKLKEYLKFISSFRIYYDPQVAFQIAKGNHIIERKNTFTTIINELLPFLI